MYGGKLNIGMLVHEGLSGDRWELLFMRSKGNGRVINHTNSKNGRVNNDTIFVHINGPMGGAFEGLNVVGIGHAFVLKKFGWDDGFKRTLC